MPRNDYSASGPHRRSGPVVATLRRPEGRCGRGGGFTLVELLIVISVVLILASIMVKVWPDVEERIVKLHCLTNLTKVHKILFEYGANNYGYLPPMCGSNGMGTIYFPKTPRHYVVEELKEYGATAAIFTCPASPAYDDDSSYSWRSWEKPRTITQSTHKVLGVDTSGYVFFIGFWPWLDDNTRHGAHFFNSGSKPLATHVDSRGNPPLAADLMRYDTQPWGTSKAWKGFYHRRDTDPDAPGGGGHTLWLDGTVQWFDWGELEAGLDTDPPTEPVWWGSWPQWSYFAGWLPREQE